MRPTRRSAMVAGVLGVAVLVGACSPAAQATFPPIGSTPQPPGDATAATKTAVVAALAGRGLQADEAVRTYRPPEGPLLAAAPRSVLQVRLTDDPDHGYIVIYSLGSLTISQARLLAMPLANRTSPSAMTTGVPVNWA